MRKIRLLIVDDEPLAHKVLEGHCEKIDFIEVVGNCYDSISTINYLSKHSVDALLLDIQLPDLTGLELLDVLKNNMPKIIFTTAYTEFALKGFDYDEVLDYLHKPIRINRFVRSIERLKKQLMLEWQNQPSADQASELSPDAMIGFITFKDNKVLYKIRLEQILYIQSWGNYIKVFLTNAEMKITRKTIKETEKELPARYFERIHKSYIVNIAQVKAIEGNQVLLDDVVLPIGTNYTVSAKKKIMGFDS